MKREIEVTRRGIVTATGATVAALGGVALVPDQSAASVSVDSFDVEDAELDSGVVPELKGDIAYDYEITGGEVDALRFLLEVDGQTVTEEELSTGSNSLESEETLSGRLTDSDEYDRQDFDVSKKETFDLEVGVVFEVVNSNGDVLAGDDATDTATLIVGSDGTASVGGVVTITAAE